MNLSTFLSIAAAIVVIVLVGAAIYFLQASNISAVVGLPMLSIGAVIVLMILLCLMAVIFSTFGLQDKTQALALPEGSIRAVIALMLIVLFAILSIYLYGSLASRQLSYMGALESNTRDNLVKLYGGENIISAPNADGKNVDVWLQQTSSPAGVDFAKQLLVLVGTLVTSICSFYFGSKTATQSYERAANAPLPPVVETFTPATYKRGTGPQDFTLTGSSLDRITGLKLSLNGKQIAATAVKASADQVRLKLDVSNEQEAGIWQLTLSDSKLGEQATSQSLIVT
ncbi:hypothetical protein ELI20_37220 [Rhizobium ruizarguesonis]|uniref:hypothetical protein n=1 Tax=Rhizobium ruizarguesonis TaxID=2081791 RepID=UPI0010321ECF|nr:hypothetical protein [Rhizobium ruizarguesonis]TAW03849.1 hypothetical protein ELI20_37220 [Rhizobium ruizarguesonis]